MTTFKKTPYLLEFLELKENKEYHEKHIEQALISNLQEFLLELGKRLFICRATKAHNIGRRPFLHRLVFYNYILRCFTVIDLKVGKLTHQDIGPLDFYVRYFDDKIRQKDDNPTIGLIFAPIKTKASQNTRC